MKPTNGKQFSLKQAYKLFRSEDYTSALMAYEAIAAENPFLANFLTTNIRLCKRRILSQKVGDVPSEKAEPSHIVFTIVARNYFSYAKVLMRSVREHHPNTTRYVVLADRGSEALNSEYDLQDFTLISVDSLKIECLEDMALRYNVMEFSTSIKPFAFSYFFKMGRHELITYLDPDIKLYSPMIEVLLAYEEGSQCVMTPHVTSPYTDKKQPDEHAILKSGVYNCGFVSFLNTAAASTFVTWWSEKLKTLAHSDIPRNLFTDQRWCDLVTSFVDRVKILRHPGYNVAYWNLHERALSKVSGVWHSNGRPLSFFHFSGINPLNPKVISKHQNRFNRENIKFCSSIFDEYIHELLSQGWDSYRRLDYLFSAQWPGVGFPPPVRKLYAANSDDALVLHPPDLEQYLIDLCNSRAELPNNPLGNKWVTRLMHQIYLERLDLRNSFALSSPEGPQALIRWFLESAEREYGLGANVTTKAFFRSVGRVAAKRDGDSLDTSGLLDNIRCSRRDLTTTYADSDIEGLREWGCLGLPREYGFQPSNHGVTIDHSVVMGDRGINIVGYLKGEFGLGEHARATMHAFETQDLPVTTTNFDYGLKARQHAGTTKSEALLNISPRVNLIHINADQMQKAFSVLGDRVFGGRYNIGYWAWELQKAPSEWAYATEFVDEIWVPSNFVAQGFKEITGKPVIVMPECVTIDAFKASPRKTFKLPEDVFIFMFSFDMSSYFHRKNPLATIDAFNRAFSNDSSTLLVVKINNSFVHKEARAKLESIAARQRNLVIIDETMTREAYLSFLNCIDVYVSLHRSEGFGRGPAEAMLLGKPTIMTAFSGNLEYSDDSSASMVRYRLVEVKEGEYPHYAGNVWAEADADHAAECMLRVRDDSAYRCSIAHAGYLKVSGCLAPEIVGSRYAKRLRSIGLI